MSTKAPTPFTGTSSSKASPSNVGVSSSSSSSFPPMSSKAPTPFGISGKASTAKAPSTASSFPPISKTAPSPFNTGSAVTPSLSARATDSSEASSGKAGVTSVKIDAKQVSKVGDTKDKSSTPANPFTNFSFGNVSAPQWPIAKPAGSEAGDKTEKPSFGFSFPTASVTGGSGGFGSSGIGSKEVSGSAKTETASSPNATTSASKSSAPSSVAKTDTIQTATNDIKLDSAAAKSARRAFDDIDTDGKGEVASSLFELLLESLGEGFYGDELDKQLSLVDPESTGIICRSSFIGWYVHLVEGCEDDEGKDGVDDSSSLDTDERAERAEELEKISVAFAELNDGKNVQSIKTANFGQLMEAMGTAYCEEAHRRTVKKLDNGGIITQDAFTGWYIDWLFGDGDDDSIVDEDSSSAENEDGDDAGESNAISVSSSSKAAASSWGGIFATEAGSWKCDSCMVKNKPDVAVCVACETPRPGHEDQESSSSEKACAAVSSSNGSSIGVGGFTFGGAATSPSTATTTSAPLAFSGTSGTSTGAAQGGGFSFGSQSVSSASASGSSDTNKGGFGVGTLPSGGFQFGTSVVKGVNATPSTSEKVKESNEEAQAVSAVSVIDELC